MRSFFLINSILRVILFIFFFTTVNFMDYHYGWELKRGFNGLLAYLFVELVMINSKLNDILESRKTDDYHGGVGIK